MFDELASVTAGNLEFACQLERPKKLFGGTIMGRIRKWNRLFNFESKGLKIFTNESVFLYRDGVLQKKNLVWFSYCNSLTYLHLIHRLE